MKFEVPELTINANEKMLDLILRKVTPTHSLRIKSSCGADSLWPLISGLKLKRLECNINTMNYSTFTLFDSLQIKSKLISPFMDN